jgi:hypothetical protein
MPVVRKLLQPFGGKKIKGARGSAETVRDPIRLQPARANPIEEFVGHRLQTPVAVWLDLHAGLASGLGLVGGGGTAGRERSTSSGVAPNAALEQVSRAVIAPFGGRDRRQVVDPLRRPGPMRFATAACRSFSYTDCPAM